ncbi:hypothetical protein [Phaeobacter inhibens]|uniref:hypothetical protein n=1 Tax=Phaeobacter inhibens TaxID=221822 RepID=UPI00295E8B6F|nr:hypothetical protein [Phaeobacter inhibens]
MSYTVRFACVMRGPDNDKNNSPVQAGQKDEAMTKIPPEFNPETAPPRLTIDWEAYLPFLENEDISEEHKHELIEALWSIMVSFVDLGFGIHPVQLACGKDISLADLPVADMVKSEATAEQFEKAAGPRANGPQKRSPHV